MNNTGFLDSTELDFTTTADSLKKFLQSQDQFKDYNFDGSNLAVLIDILAYNTHLNALYLNMTGSEMFFDTATMRESIVSHAKELNYTPRSRVSSVAYVDIAVTGNNLPGSIMIPKNYQVHGRGTDGTIYTFLTADAVVIGGSDNYTAQNVPVYEGKLINETFVVEPGTRFVLQSENVDVNSIEVHVQTSASDSTTEAWRKETTLFGVSDSVSAFFVQGYKSYGYELVFGNGKVGKKLINGNIVRVKYRATAGEAANGIRSFTAPNSIQGFSNVSVKLNNTTSYASGGSYQETDSEIKFNAPRYFQTQERAVTDSDYVTLLKSQFPQLSSVTAFGGETVEPKKYGKTVICAKPRGGEVLPNSVKDQITKFLKNRTSLAIDPIIVDPDYYHVGITTTVTYDLNATVKTPTEMEAAVQTAIMGYNEDQLDDFSSDLRFSRLSSAIDSAEKSVVSNDTEILMMKKLYPVLGSRNSFTFNFSNEIRARHEQCMNTKVNNAVVYSSPFEWRTGTKSYNVYIEDNGLGKLNIVTVDLQDNKVVLWDGVGTVDYKSGIVAITNLIVQKYFGDALNIYATLNKADIETNSNQILAINPKDIKINVDGIRV